MKPKLYLLSNFLPPDGEKLCWYENKYCVSIDKTKIMQNPLKQPQLINLVWFCVLIGLLLNSIWEQDKFMDSILV